MPKIQETDIKKQMLKVHLLALAALRHQFHGQVLRDHSMHLQELGHKISKEQGAQPSRLSLFNNKDQAMLRVLQVHRISNY